MDKITKLCLKRPVSTVIIIIALLIFGLSAIPEMNMQLTPDMEMPMIICYTIYPQASPSEVDKLVTQELEDVGATIEGLDGIMGRSMENMSYVIYEFEYGTDIDKAYQSLQEEITAKRPDLPEDCKAPTLIIMDINAVESMIVSVTSTSGSDVRTFVEDTFDPEVSSISTVARTEVSGGTKDYISVTVNPGKMTEYGLNLSGISNSIKSADFSMPAGTVDYGTQVMAVDAEVSYDDLFALESIPITTAKGQTIRLSDVADVHYDVKDADSISRHNGVDNISLSITKKQGSNAVSLSKSVKKVVKKLEEKYPDMQFEITYDSSESIISALKTVAETMVAGVILSMLVLFIFFGDIKASLIVGSSMPVSLLLSLILMNFAGYSLNVLTMGAMVLGIGMIVDNSIVVLEMCFQKKEEGKDFFDAAYSAVKTVVLSVTASTITTVVVYLPMATIKGLAGQMFAPLGFTIIFLLIASLICAITLVPLCFYKYCPIENKGFLVNKLVKKFASKYATLLNKILNKKWLAILALVAMLGVTILAGTQIHTELMPATDEGTVRVSVQVRPGLSLENKDAVLMDLEQFVAADPDVESYDVSGASSGSSLSVTAYLKEDRVRDTKVVVDEWNQALSGKKDVDITCSSSSSSMSSMGGETSKSVDIKSHDVESLKEAANIVADSIRGIDGVTAVNTDFSDSSAKAEIKINPVRAAALNVTPNVAAGMLYAAKSGSEATKMTINEREYAITVEYPDGKYDTIQQMLNMSVPSNTGKQVMLSEIADVVYTDSPQTLMRTDKFYTCSVTATLISEKRFDAEAAIEAAKEDINLPRGVEFTDNMMDTMQADTFGDFGKAILTALFLVFMVMTIQFESARFSGMIMFTIPFSLIGSVLLLFVTGTTLSMTSLMGFLMLEGIVVNNGILFVDTANQFRETMSLNEALVKAGESRLRPILMTTLTTILSMVPLGLGIGKNGAQMQGMAIVIIGGLIASTILTLIFLPTFYIIIDKKPKKDKEKK